MVVRLGLTKDRLGEEQILVAQAFTKCGVHVSDMPPLVVQIYTKELA